MEEAPPSRGHGNFFKDLDAWLYEQLTRAFVRTIQAHGPITKEFSWSAAKRLIGLIRADVRQYIQVHVDEGTKRLLDERDEEIVLLKEKVKTLIKTADHWRALAQKPSCSESNS